MSLDDDELERLLARGHLSGATYDRIESSLMKRVLPQARRPRPAWLRFAVVPAAAALVAFALYLGRSSKDAEEAAGFTAKGAGPSSLAGAVELACAAHRGCRLGDTLVFVVDTSLAHGYLNASARRVEPKSSELIHFFPAEDGSSPRIEAGTGTIAVPRGVRLGGALTPGVYRVDIWFTDAAPSSHPREGRSTSVELVVEES